MNPVERMMTNRIKRTKTKANVPPNPAHEPATPIPIRLPSLRDRPFYESNIPYVWTDREIRI